MSGRVKTFRELKAIIGATAKKPRGRRRAWTSGRHGARGELCAENGVKNTGRQWRNLRKRLQREELAQRRFAAAAAAERAS